jgi:hypothetical protein
MKPKGYYRREITIEWNVEREVKLPQGVAYVLYWIVVGCETEGPGGDGINEPRYGASASVFTTKVVTVQVNIVQVDMGEEDEQNKAYNGAFIGPIEEGLARPGFSLELTDSEREAVEERALEQAWVEPDGDDEYERKMDL